MKIDKYIKDTELIEVVKLILGVDKITKFEANLILFRNDVVYYNNRFYIVNKDIKNTTIINSVDFMELNSISVFNHFNAIINSVDFTKLKAIINRFSNV